MAPRKLFGSLNLAGNVDPGENPNGQVTQGPNGTHINGRGADGDDYIFGVAADGPRWNKTAPARLEDRTIMRPIAIVASRKR